MALINLMRKPGKSVWKYKEEWDKLTERIGFWLDLKDPYITYEPHYIESFWHIDSANSQEENYYIKILKWYHIVHVAAQHFQAMKWRWVMKKF